MAQEGYKFLLRDAYSQLWVLLRRYIANAEQRSGNHDPVRRTRPDALRTWRRFSFRILSCDRCHAAVLSCECSLWPNPCQALVLSAQSLGKPSVVR